MRVEAHRSRYLSTWSIFYDTPITTPGSRTNYSSQYVFTEIVDVRASNVVTDEAVNKPSKLSVILDLA